MWQARQSHISFSSAEKFSFPSLKSERFIAAALTPKASFLQHEFTPRGKVWEKLTPRVEVVL
jgi:hypothetical protein